MFITNAPFWTMGMTETITSRNASDFTIHRGVLMTSPSATTEAVVNATSLTSMEPSATSVPVYPQSIVIIVVEMVVLGAIWVAALVGNSLVCLVIYRSRRLQSTTNYFVVSLAGADLVYAVVVMPLMLTDLVAQSWMGGPGLCKVVRYVQLFVPITMVIVLVAICMDRFYTIIYPLSFKVSRGSAKRMILLSWLVASVLASPGLYIYGLQPDPTSLTGEFHCKMFLQSQGESLYIIFLSVTAYFLPIFGISMGYMRIFRFIWRSGVGGRSFQRTANPVPRSKVKMVKLIIVVNLVILLLMAPWFISQLYFCSRPSPSSSDRTIYLVVVWVFFSNTVAKPTIYLCYNSNFRRGCKEVLCMSSMKCYRSNAYTITATSTFGKRNHIGISETSIYGRENRRIDSPTKTFDRTTLVDKIAWPISSQTPSTYL